MCDLQFSQSVNKLATIFENASNLFGYQRTLNTVKKLYFFVLFVHEKDKSSIGYEIDTIGPLNVV
jgi:hypothetical protein